MEDLLHEYLQSNPSTTTDNLLLHAGFIDIASSVPQLMSQREHKLVTKAITSTSSKPTHDISSCIRECFKNCRVFNEFIDARDSFSCKTCKYDPQCQLSIATVIYTVHLLSNTVVLSIEYLEGDYDTIWTNVIDNIFMSPHGRLHRKEKPSPLTLSSCKFDGLYIGGRVDPQEWLVVEVGRESQGPNKESQDRQKLVEHCLRIMNHRRWYLNTRTNLHGKALVPWLTRFPVWGVLCQGLRVEIMKFCWLTRGVGVVTTFASRFPNHLLRVESLYRIVGEVHYAFSSVKSCVENWDALHEKMVGNQG